jgi:hypothetical protein
MDGTTHWVGRLAGTSYLLTGYNVCSVATIIFLVKVASSEKHLTWKQKWYTCTRKMDVTCLCMPISFANSHPHESVHYCKDTNSLFTPSLLFYFIAHNPRNHTTSTWNKPEVINSSVYLVNNYFHNHWKQLFSLLNSNIVVYHNKIVIFLVWESLAIKNDKPVLHSWVCHAFEKWIWATWSK